MNTRILAALLCLAPAIASAEVAVFDQGLVLTQVHRATPDWPDIRPNADEHERDQDVETEYRTVPGMKINVRCEGECYIRIFGHVMFQVEGCRADGKEPDDRVLIPARIKLDGENVWQSAVNVLKWQHYDDRPFFTARVLGPGKHQVLVQAKFQTLNDDSCDPVLFKRTSQQELIVEVLE